MSVYKWPDVQNSTTGKVKQIGSCQAEGKYAEFIFYSGQGVSGSAAILLFLISGIF